MKILAIGCAHGNLSKIKKMPLDGIDLVLLCGDLGSADLMRKTAFERIKRKKAGLLPSDPPKSVKKKIFFEAHDSAIALVKYLAKKAPVLAIYGNVEFWRAETKAYEKALDQKLPVLDDSLHSIKGVKLINGKKTRFKGLKICGIHYFIDDIWMKTFEPHNAVFRERAKRDTPKYRKIMEGFGKTDILISHIPPHGVLDKVTFRKAPAHWRGKHAGSKVVLDYIKKHHPKYVFCAHIHEGKGVQKIGKSIVFNLGNCGYKMVEI